MFRFSKRFLETPADEDVRQELEAHLAIEKAEQRAAGKSPEQAEQAARVLFGNAVRVREDIHEQSPWAAFERCVRDMRFGARLLIRSPLWTAVVCLTLALGIGIGTAIFSVVYSVLLAPLPYPQPDRIVAVHPVSPQPEAERFNANPALWLHWRDRLTSIGDLALTRPVVNFNLTGSGSPERLQGARITYNLTRVFGVRPLLGREFTEQEQLSDARVVLLSHGLWTRRFGADPSVVDRKIDLNGVPHRVVGVMPPEFAYPDSKFEVWAPLFLPASDIGHGYNYGYRCTGRLREGATLARAQAELDTVMSALAKEHPEAYQSGDHALTAVMLPLAESQAGDFRPTLLMLSAAVACLLALGCLNLAVLMIARAGSRSREILVRVSLGATGARLRRQLLAEAIPLALGGAMGGVALAHFMVRALVPMLPAGVPRAEAIGIDGTAVAFSLLCGATVVLLASLLPARLSRMPHLSAQLTQNSRTVIGGGRARDILVAAQVAIATLLVFAAILFGRSFTSLLAVHPGFNGQGVLTMHFAVSRAKFHTDEQVSDYYDRLVRRIRSVPGVVEAGIVNRLPLSGTTQTGGVEFEGKADRPLAAAAFMADWRSVTPGYFKAIGIPLLRGRLIRESDRANSPRVGLIDIEFAKALYGDANPIGKRFRRSVGQGLASDEPWSEIVGVVGHVLNDSLEKDARAQVYWPETQRTQDRAALVVRTGGSPATFASTVIAQVRAENPDQPVYDVRTMKDWIAKSMQTRTLATTLIGLFGIASVLLACLGLYGAISYSAGLRKREFGIRLALGATAAEVLRMVLNHAGKVVLAGMLIGLALCWATGKALTAFLFGVTAKDPQVWLLAPALMLFVSLIAALSPALRAARTNPAATLQSE